MPKIDDAWFTGEFGQQLRQPVDQPPHHRPCKLPPATQRAVDDINRRYPGELDDEIPL